jgi:1A family penicillin-binding protein
VVKQKKVVHSRPSLLKVLSLCVQIVLLKIGQIPFLVIKSLLPTKKSRGRPRKLPFFSFHLRRLRKFVKNRIPRRAKIAFILGTALLIISSYTAFLLTTAYMLPSPTKLSSVDKPLTTEFYDRQGKLLYRLYEGRNRTLVSLDEIPPYLIEATIATEDKNFYKHFGFDPVAVIRATYTNVVENRREGASTITQQLIKNSLLSPEKTFSRKFKELVLAFWAERVYSKNDILQMYFNETPYGGPTWGIEAAAQTYFGKSTRDLDLAESAFLAGLPASPTEFSPYGSKPELAKNRQALVLQRMKEEGYITDEERANALSEELKLQPPVSNILAPHFVFFVKDYLSQKYGNRVVSQGGLKVQTTLDLSVQQEVEKIVKTGVDSLSGLNVKNGAAMVTNPKTGEILAMVGSRDYYYPGFGNFNATNSLRQPGSSIKPVTFATAFKKGFSPGNTILDTPVVFKDNWGNSYSPVNYDGTFRGPVSIRTALGSSLNIPAVKLLATVGVDDMIQTSRDMGITTFTDTKNYGLSLTLGGGATKMVEMMGVYGTLAQMGTYHAPTSILKVVDSSGNILEEYDGGSKPALEPGIAYLVTDILADNKARTPAFGPNSLLNLPGIAVKTGTSDSKRDNWTFGYSPDFVVGVWVGNPDNSPMNQSLTSGITGAAPIWNNITKFMLAKYPSKGFTRPTGIVDSVVDGRKDISLAGSVPKGLVRTKTEADKFTFRDAFSVYATSSATQARDNDQATN